MKLRWGILATGSIARSFAKGVAASNTGKLVAVGSRSDESAAKFCDEYGGRPHGSYDSLLADPEVDAVYIATPHHLHEQNTIDAARAGKHILCEKPFTLNTLEAERALAEVKKAGVFFMEAFMYRCHPQTRKAAEIVRSGKIGSVIMVNAEFGFSAGRDWANFRADGKLGGGGLMDVGCYAISLTRLMVGEEPTRCEYVMRQSPKGYDEWGSGIMQFPSGATAQFGTGIHANLRNHAIVYGDAGRLTIPSPWFVNKPMTLEIDGAEAQTIEIENDANLYAIEADSVAEFLSARQCPYMSIDDTLGNMRALDAMRKSAGLAFEMEAKA